MSGQQSPFSSSPALSPVSSLPVSGSIPAQSGPSSSSSFQLKQRSETIIRPEPIPPEQLTEERSKWINQIFSENPEYLALREQILKLSGGLSFSNVKHSQTAMSMSAISRYTILELIYQHLNAIGMYKTAEILTNESGHSFQDTNQPWDRTDLLLLTSMAVGHREDAWNIANEPYHQYIEECLEEDLFSSPYREDETTIWDEYFEPTLNAKFDKDGHLIAASLKRLILYQLENDDDDQKNMFFLVLHSITSAEHFLRILVHLFDFDYDREKYPKEVEQSVMDSTKINIINLIKKWISFHGLFIGNKACTSVKSFMARISSSDNNSYIKKHADITRNAMKGMTYGPKVGKLIRDCPPCIPDPQVIFKQSLTVLDPEPIEIARQIALIYHEKYAAVHSLEFIIAIKNRGTTIQTPTLNDFFMFGEHITELFADTYLNADNKNAAYERIFEIINHLNSPDFLNLDAVSCLSQLMLRPDIRSFLKKTESIRQKEEQLLEMWIGVGENDKNEPVHPTKYEQRISNAFDAWSPSIPNMHVEIKQISKDVLAMPDFIDDLINWEKTSIIAKKCANLYRSQTKFYSFWAIPQIRNMILRGASSSSQSIQEQLKEIQRINLKLD